MNNLTDILQRFIDKRATKEEREEFFSLLNQGAFDHLVSQDMIETWASEAPATQEEKSLLASANERIRAIHDLGAAKVVPFEKKRSPVWMAAAAAIVIVIVAGVWMIKEKHLFRDKVAQQEELKPSVYTGKRVVVLPDGTEVIMNEQSELRYDHTFGEKSREISFIGEGFFDVKHDPSKPFIVHTGKVSTTVLGTAFNINAYPDKHEVTVTVARGLVQVGDDKRIYGKINPNQQISVSTVTNEFTAKDVNAENVVAWKNKFFILDRVTIAEAAVLIGERFNVNVTIANEDIKGCVIGAWFLNNEGLYHILTVVSGVQQATFTVKDDSVTIEGGIGCGNE